MNLNHSRFILITHRKVNQNQSNRLGGVHTHTDGHKKYIYKDRFRNKGIGI